VLGIAFCLGVKQELNIAFLGVSKKDINSKQIDSQIFSYLTSITSSVKFIPIKKTNNVKASAKM